MYRSMIKMYYRGVDVPIIVFDLTERKSFESVAQWLEDLREKQSVNVKLESKRDSVAAATELECYILGNKSDLADHSVSAEEVDRFIKEQEKKCNDTPEGEDPPALKKIRLKYFEVSAKTGTGIP
mmetsp:Transcript_36849/g.56414  ORF Transcript_36849/g.56414 Transcript_36849/m.56414 type:complete len:125 (+) Transcript_36849:228-602(+)